VYQYVTEAERAAIKASTYQYPLMKMQEVVWFQNAYKANCDAWDAGNKAKVEGHWQQAFANAESQSSSDVAKTTQEMPDQMGGAAGEVVGQTVGGPGGRGVGPQDRQARGPHRGHPGDHGH